MSSSIQVNSLAPRRNLSFDCHEVNQPLTGLGQGERGLAVAFARTTRSGKGASRLSANVSAGHRASNIIRASDRCCEGNAGKVTRRHQ